MEQEKHNREEQKEQKEQEQHTEGFDMIAERMGQLYPGQTGKYYGVLIPYMLGGNDPLDGVEVWQSERGIPHWHYVTYGFSELYEKQSDYLEESGFGFELTFRLKREAGETEPPVWPINLLQNLARYVFSSGNVFADGHHMNCNGPVALESDTELTALGFRVDPELGDMDTPNGRVTFLQAVAITHGEMNGMMCWSGQQFLQLLAQSVPLCVTDLSRASLMDDEAFRAAWRQGVARDGSSTGCLYMDELAGGLDGSRGWLQLGAGHVETILNMLRARVGKDRELYLQGSQQAISVQRAQTGAVRQEGDVLAIELPDEALNELEAVLEPHAGTYRLATAPLEIRLMPTTIRDAKGNVLQVIE